MSIPIVGKVFATAAPFMAYLEGLSFGVWRPRYVVMHHTGAPDLKTWRGWQTRAKPVTDEQWMKNLQKYYESLGWSRAPQFFFTPKHFCVLSLPTVRGTHAVSFNANSWGVECVGDFDSEPFDGDVQDRYVEGLAALHVAAGLQLLPFEKKVRGLHFHRDDPLTSKTCPGKNVRKPELIKLVAAKMSDMTGGDHPDEKIETVKLTAAQPRQATVNTAGLNMRAAASGKAPVIKSLAKGVVLHVIDKAMNGETQWLKVELANASGWVAARYVNQ